MLDEVEDEGLELLDEVLLVGLVEPYPTLPLDVLWLELLDEDDELELFDGLELFDDVDDDELELPDGLRPPAENEDDELEALDGVEDEGVELLDVLLLLELLE